MRIERRNDLPWFIVVLVPFGAIAAALMLCAGLILLAGVNPLVAYAEMFRGAAGSKLAITETLTRAVPLVLTGLAAAVAFRARLWNIGAEGQFFMGALVTAWAGHGVVANWPPALAIAGLLVGGAFAGALTLLGPLILRLRFGVDEVVTTLLLNFIVILFVGMMVEGPLKDPMGFGWPQSVPVARGVMLPDLVARSRLHIGLLFAVVAAIAVWMIQSRTVFGAKSRAIGLSPRAAVFAGIPLSKTLFLVAALSGGLAGSAGVIEVIGVTGYVTTTMSPGFGYAGIVVAMLAALHPAGVFAAALFIATIFVGADSMSRATGVPSFIADVIMSVALLTMLTALMLTTYRVRR